MAVVELQGIVGEPPEALTVLSTNIERTGDSIYASRERLRVLRHTS